MVSRGRGGPPRRTPSTKSVRLSLLVFAEGVATERQYVNHWYRLFRDRVTVEFAPEHGTPLRLVELAVAALKSEARDEKRGRGRGHDQIWCVFDRDEHPHLRAAFELAEQHGIRVAFSNPCLELWFLWHFEDRTGYMDRHSAQRAVRSHLKCEKNLSPGALEQLAAPERFERAKARALAAEEKHLGDGSPGRENPSSDVWRLVDAIRGG
jgi:hypothetical protein